MTPTYDRTELFLAPPLRGDAARPVGTPPAIDHRAEAMRALCHPFAVRTQPVVRPAR